MQTTSRLYGLMAEFDEPDDLLEAAKQAYAAGYRRMDAYSPFPIEGLAEAINTRQTRLPLLVLIGGCIGAVGGFMLQYYASVIDYPLNIGGRPFKSWPAFVPVMFETTILCAALSAVLGMLALNGLPQPYHPVFNVDQFARASSDRFFLSIEAVDPQFNPEQTRQFLQRFAAREVTDVAY